MSKKNGSSNLDSISSEGNTSLISKNITVNGHRTSIRLEPEMWRALGEVALRERCSIHDICSLVSIRKKELSSLTASIRVFLMLYYRSATTEEGHMRAGHGDFSAMRARALANTPKQEKNEEEGQRGDGHKMRSYPAYRIRYTDYKPAKSASK